MGDATVWASIASLLAVFDFKKARDAQGNEIDVIPVFGDGAVRQGTHIHAGALSLTRAFFSHPLPFECDITVRSEAARKLILG
jgi:hypothetical protein